MRVIVVGAGVVGMTTAWYLARRHVDVTVIDRHDEAAAATSHANGGQLSYSFCDALGGPAYVRRLPALLRGRISGGRMRLSADLLPWGLRFLLQCTQSRADANTLDTLERALRSAELMAALIDEVDVDFSYRPAGKMVLLASDEDIRHAKRSIKLKAALGCDIELLDAHASVALEPALEAFTTRPVASIYSRGDAVGDARAFAAGLRHVLESQHGVRFCFGQTVTGLCRERSRVTGACTATEEHRADAVVVCAGTWSNRLLRALGQRLPLYPMRGYSVTLPAGSAAPSVSITALSQHFVISRFGERVRIAGFGDFVGFDDSNDARRIALLFELAEELAPQAADYTASERHAWGGYRPMTPDSRPRVGATSVPGLYTNTGHGTLGWTLACESGDRIARLVTESR